VYLAREPHSATPVIVASHLEMETTLQGYLQAPVPRLLHVQLTSPG
jgi:hypothetical protein